MEFRKLHIVDWSISVIANKESFLLFKEVDKNNNESNRIQLKIGQNFLKYLFRFGPSFCLTSNKSPSDWVHYEEFSEDRAALITAVSGSKNLIIAMRGI